MGYLKSALILGIVALLVLGTLPGAALAQADASGESYSLESGSELGWTQPWEIDERTSGYSQDASGDVVTLENGDATFILTTYPSVIDPAGARDALLAQYEQTRDDVASVDSIESRSVAVGSLIFADAKGDTWGSYSEWTATEDGDTIIGFEMIAPVDGIGTAVENVQSGITLDAAEVFPDADAATIAESMSAAVNDGSSTGKTSTGKSTTKTKTKTGKTTKTSTLDPSFVEAGLVSETEYTSPQFGYGVSWGAPWTLNPNDDAAVVSDTEGVSDELYIATDDPDFALVSIIGIESDGTTPADATDTWASQEFLDKYAGPGTEVLLQDSNRTGGAVVTLGSLKSNEDVTVVIVREVVSMDSGDTLVLMTLIVPVEEFSSIYGSAQAQVTLEGDPVLSYFTTAEIESLLP